MTEIINIDIPKFQLVDPKTAEEKRVTITEDDGIRPNASQSDLAKLKTIFKKSGTTTAGMLISIVKLHGKLLFLHRVAFP